jgi:hypothetical protein
MNIIAKLTTLFGAAAAVLLLGSFVIARGDTPATVPAASVSDDAIFNWKELPVNTKVPLVRAAFDQGGYQLYDKVGEVIVVPFENNNLYVMKFARAEGASESYFINVDGVPTVYLTAGAYFENSAVPGAKWYPFTDRFHPHNAVYLGPAPSWDVFVGMNWYPGMIIRAGYWSSSPFGSVEVFTPALAFSISIGDKPYRGWDAFIGYAHSHPVFVPDAPIVINHVPFHWGRPAFSYDHHDAIFGGRRDNFGRDAGPGGRDHGDGGGGGAGRDNHPPRDGDPGRGSGGRDPGGPF